MTEIRDMTRDDKLRLRAHRGAFRLFPKLVQGGQDGRALFVAQLGKAEWTTLRTLTELGFVDVDDGRVIVNFSIGSLVALGYL